MGNVLDLFDCNEKIEAFNRIASEYYIHNFGEMSKADFELLLFDIYLKNKTGGISDYDISKELGITQSRVRSLRERRELKYSTDKKSNWWKDEFLKRVRYSKYDKETRIIKMSIPDIEVMIELRHFVEGLYLFDDYQLNPKVFACRVDIFIEICKQIDNTNYDSNSPLDEKLKSNLKNKLKILNKSLKKEDMDILSDAFNSSVSQGLKKIVRKGSDALLECFISTLPFGSYVKDAIDFVLDSIRE